MSILSQIGIIVLIIGIVIILARSDKQLVEAAKEGEHFVDEWALKEERKQKLIEAKQLKKQQRMKKKKGKQYQGQEFIGQQYQNQQFQRPTYGEPEGIWKDETGEGNRYQPESGYQLGSGYQPAADEIANDAMAQPEIDAGGYERRLLNVSLELTALDEKRNPIRKIPVKKCPFTIGRDYRNDLVIDDLCVAKRHCRIVEKNYSLVMEDGGSRNRIMADGCPRREILLKDGLIVGIGSMEFMVELR